MFRDSSRCNSVAAQRACYKTGHSAPTNPKPPCFLILKRMNAGSAGKVQVDRTKKFRDEHRQHALT